MPYFDKHFTLEEANALLPRIREIFKQVQALIAQGLKAGKVEGVKTRVQLVGRGRRNGHAKKSSPSVEEIRSRINALLSEITDQGIVIQDVQRGLIDFPCFLNEHEVFLCYEVNDGETIQFWHAIDAGYAGRTPIA